MDDLDCDVCFNELDEDVRQPRTLPCGHTLCTVCIDEGLKNGHVLCPFCRKRHNATAASAVPLNFSLLKVVKTLKAFSVTSMGRPNERATTTKLPSSVALEPDLHAGICSEHGSYKLFWCHKCKLWVCRDCTVVNHPASSCTVMSVKEAFNTIKKEEEKLVGQSSRNRNNHVKVLNDLLSKLNDCKNKHREQINTFKTLIEKQETTIDLLEKKSDRVKSCLQAGDEMFNAMITKNKELSEADNTSDITKVRHGSQICRKYMQKWIKSSNRELARCDLLDKSIKLQKILGRTLKLADVEQTNGTCFVLVVLQNCIGREMIQRTLTAPDMTDLLQVATVWTVLADKSKAAPITQDGQNIRLHSLRKAVPPNNAITVPYGDVKKLFEKSPVAFMDLSYAGQRQGSVHIQIGDDCEKDESFLRRFTGETTSFLNSKVIEQRRGNKGENGLIVGGDGTRGPVTEPGTINEEIYRFPSDSLKGRVTLAQLNGTTCFTIWEDEKRDQFGYPYGYQCTQRVNRKIIGKVCEGLDVVQKAAQQRDLTKIDVNECGIFIKYIHRPKTREELFC